MSHCKTPEHMFTDAGVKGAAPTTKLSIRQTRAENDFFLLVAVPAAGGDKYMRPAYKPNI